MFYKIYYICLEWYYKIIYKLEIFTNPESFYDYISDTDSESIECAYYNNEVYV